MTNAPLTEQQRKTRAVLTLGAALLVLAALSAILFAVAGLLGRVPLTMAACATVAAGAGLMFQGVTVASRWGRGTQIVGRERIDLLGMSAEITGGAFCTAVGLVSLDAPDPTRALTVAAIVLAVAVLLGGRTQADLVVLAPTTKSPFQLPRTLEEVTTAVMIAGGVVALLFGMMAVAATTPVLPIVFALICVAAALLFAGGGLFARYTRPVSG